MKKVLIIIGSKSDFDVILPCCKVLDKFGIAYSLRVCSAHRTPDLAASLAKNAEKDGFGVIIGAAGKAAHLAGVLAGHSVLPVIGLPVKSSTMDGLDSLLSMVQMPQGVPVATVAINGGYNAGLLAVQILATGDAALTDALKAYKKEIEEAVISDDKAVQEMLNKNA